MVLDTLCIRESQSAAEQILGHILYRSPLNHSFCVDVDTYFAVLLEGMYCIRKKNQYPCHHLLEYL